MYLRVTDILYHFSGLSHIPAEILKNAAERGSKVHEIADSLINGLGGFGTTEQTEGYIRSLEQWLPGKEFIKTPGRFYDDELMLTGECDALYKDGDGLVLIDFKTPVKESPTWRLQGSAYAYLARKAGHNIKRIEFIKLDKFGKAPKVYTYGDDFKLFLACYDVYKYFYSKGGIEFDIEDI